MRLFKFPLFIGMKENDVLAFRLCIAWEKLNSVMIKITSSLTNLRS